MTDQKPPNCENCPNSKMHTNYGLGTTRPRCDITKWFLDTSTFHAVDEDYFSKSCCPLHPDARAWLMAPVIKELEHKKTECDSFPGKPYFVGKLDAFDEAITLIKNGVEKE